LEVLHKLIRILDPLFELLTSWEINVFSDTRLLSRQNHIIDLDILASRD
jgi:hypothetical protein